MTRIFIVIGLLAATLVAPFLLRPETEVTQNAKAERLVIISPHNQTIRSEFERAFVRHMAEAESRKVEIDWRQPGATAEIARFLRSEFENAFRIHWERKPGRKFTAQVANSWNNPRASDEARRAFLESDVGVGIDLFFGGGPFEFNLQADAGILVPTDLPEKHPGWFSDEVIPAKVSGEAFYDPEFRWVGTCLTTFGICYNVDSLDRLGVGKPPTQWMDLADPRYFGQIALADPTQSGSATKAFEMLIQQQMRMVLEKESDVELAVRKGWDEAMRLILMISANSRYFTDDATKVPLDVSSGDAAAGMCIDFYGRTYNQKLANESGESRIEFLAPIGGTSVSVDPIGQIRGAPSPELASDFIEFVLSPEGQRLWNYQPGVEGGPGRTALRRLPVRKDLYMAKELSNFTDAEALPYENADAFTYEADWTGRVFNPLRFVVRVACVDVHREQKAAWKKLIEADFPPQALATFLNVEEITLEKAETTIREAQRSEDKIEVIRLARDMAIHFRDQYNRAGKLADEGR